ncbi:hypothetical protein JTE90_003663 [Oedothorax gibbosus]|uniref:Uncharacterized protein n=1 Tax=Oedothorax gibbosus TaxID=931172 RepID=A0AAV6VT56_9ARAC|nr:hypothetical protein JTE90_003663 [Oedothorax gibbosus]
MNCQQYLKHQKQKNMTPITLGTIVELIEGPISPTKTSSKALPDEYIDESFQEDDLLLPHFSNLPRYFDPNVGITGYLPSLKVKYRADMSQSWNIAPYFLNEFKVSSFCYEDDCILLFGGLNPSQPDDFVLGCSIFEYHIKSKEWRYYGCMMEPRCYHATARMQSYVYVTGGYSHVQRHGGEMSAVSHTDRLDLRTTLWERCARMNAPRAAHAMVASGRNLFVFGGRDSSGNVLASVEAYYPGVDVWTVISHLPEPSMGLSAALVGGDIWIGGGINANKSGDPILSGINCFSPTSASWTPVEPLPVGRAFSTFVSSDDIVWVVGGSHLRKDSSKDTLSSCSHVWQMYLRSKQRKWELAGKLLFPAHACSAELYGDNLLIFGGIESEKGVLNSVQSFSITTKKCEKVLDLPAAITGLSTVFIPKQPQLKRCIHSNESVTRGSTQKTTLLDPPSKENSSPTKCTSGTCQEYQDSLYNAFVPFSKKKTFQKQLINENNSKTQFSNILKHSSMEETTPDKFNRLGYKRHESQSCTGINLPKEMSISENFRKENDSKHQKTQPDVSWKSFKDTSVSYDFENRKGHRHQESENFKKPREEISSNQQNAGRDTVKSSSNENSYPINHTSDTSYQQQDSQFNASAPFSKTNTFPKQLMIESTSKNQPTYASVPFSKETIFAKQMIKESVNKIQPAHASSLECSQEEAFPKQLTNDSTSKNQLSNASVPHFIEETFSKQLIHESTNKSQPTNSGINSSLKQPISDILTKNNYKHPTSQSCTAINLPNEMSISEKLRKKTGRKHQDTPYDDREQYDVPRTMFDEGISVSHDTFNDRQEFYDLNRQSFEESEIETSAKNSGYRQEGTENSVQEDTSKYQEFRSNLDRQASKEFEIFEKTERSNDYSQQETETSTSEDQEIWYDLNSQSSRESEIIEETGKRIGYRQQEAEKSAKENASTYQKFRSNIDRPSSKASNISESDKLNGYEQQCEEKSKEEDASKYQEFRSNTDRKSSKESEISEKAERRDDCGQQETKNSTPEDQEIRYDLNRHSSKESEIFENADNGNSYRQQETEKFEIEQSSKYQEFPSNLDKQSSKKSEISENITERSNNYRQLEIENSTSEEPEIRYDLNRRSSTDSEIYEKAGNSNGYRQKQNEQSTKEDISKCQEFQTNLDRQSSKEAKISEKIGKRNGYRQETEKSKKGDDLKYQEFRSNLDGQSSKESEMSEKTDRSNDYRKQGTETSTSAYQKIRYDLNRKSSKESEISEKTGHSNGCRQQETEKPEKDGTLKYQELRPNLNRQTSKEAKISEKTGKLNGYQKQDTFKSEKDDTSTYKEYRPDAGRQPSKESEISQKTERSNDYIQHKTENYTSKDQEVLYDLNNQSSKESEIFVKTRNGDSYLQQETEKSVKEDTSKYREFQSNRQFSKDTKNSEKTEQSNGYRQQETEKYEKEDSLNYNEFRQNAPSKESETSDRTERNKGYRVLEMYVPNVPSPYTHSRDTWSKRNRFVSTLEVPLNGGKTLKTIQLETEYPVKTEVCFENKKWKQVETNISKSFTAIQEHRNFKLYSPPPKWKERYRS